MVIRNYGLKMTTLDYGNMVLGTQNGPETLRRDSLVDVSREEELNSDETEE